MRCSDGSTVMGAFAVHSELIVHGQWVNTPCYVAPARMLTAGWVPLAARPPLPGRRQTQAASSPWHPKNKPWRYTSLPKKRKVGEKRGQKLAAVLIVTAAKQGEPAR